MNSSGLRFDTSAITMILRIVAATGRRFASTYYLAKGAGMKVRFLITAK